VEGELLPHQMGFPDPPVVQAHPLDLLDLGNAAGMGFQVVHQGRVQAFLPDLTALLDGWGPNADLTFTIVDPVFDGGDVATTLADVYVAPKKPTSSAEYYRVVYAWKRLAQGWRVAAEMYTVGSF